MRKKKLLFILASALTMVTQGAWAQSNTTQVLDWDNWCSITLQLTDSYGDGWNGNAIKIVDVLTGTEIGTYANTNDAKQNEAQIYQADVPDDRDIRFEWVSSGSYSSECSYEVYDVNGNLIFSGSGAMSEPVTYHVNCAIIPSNLQTADVTATTATLTWDGGAGSYNVRYRMNPSVEGFEDAVDFANWQAFGVVSTNTANDRFGRINNAKKTGSYGFSFSSWNSATDYNQYLISPEVSGVLSVEFYYRSSSTKSSGETFKVGYSTTGNNVADFTWGEEISTSSTNWNHFEDNNVPDGVKYVAIHYYAEYQYQLFVDDMTINCGSVGDWVNKTNVTSPLAIDGLAPETKYEWQVQGIYSPENTDWSDMGFTTSDIVKIDATKTLAENQSAYGMATKFLLDRTLTAGQWNTFASPFAIESVDMDKYFGAGAKVRKLGTTTIEEGNILSLNFVAASSIDAGHPYIVNPAANVDFSADGKEFEGVNLNSATETPTTTTYVDFKPTLGKTTVTGDPENILMLTTSGKLVNPSAVGDIKGFRGYFQLHDPVGGASRTRAYVIDFGDGETTGIIPIRTEAGAAVSDGATYDLQGRMVAHPTMKGIYIQNGKKLIIK